MIFCLFIKLSKAFRVSLISSQMKKIGVKHQSILEILRMKKKLKSDWPRVFFTITYKLTLSWI